jgi:hypothetical protein
MQGLRGIWLNEDFATYCKALYWESVRGFDDFCYKVIKTADEYLEEQEPVMSDHL